MCTIHDLGCFMSLSAPLRWCVNSDLEEEKCRAMSNAFTAHKLKPTILCVLSANTEGINTGADLGISRGGGADFQKILSTFF